MTDGPPKTPDHSAGKSRLDESYEALRELIVSGDFQPGSRIIEANIAERLNVSRRTVQAALTRLQREGLIQRPEGQRSPYLVASLTIRGYREIVDIMLAVECLAARRAAELGEQQRPRLAGELKNINDEILRVSAEPPPNIKRLEELDWEFHSHLASAVLGKRLMAIYIAQRPSIELYGRNYCSHMIDTRPISASEHRTLIEAIERGDGDAADLAMRNNWNNAYERYAKAIKDSAEQGAW
ncbi:MAG: GntR family transcriptional regulator [Acidobacteriota bacterium]